MSAYSKDRPNQKFPPPSASESSLSSGVPTSGENQIAVDGFKQILDMLRIADPAFRESLLRRLATRDRDLARSLRADLGI